MDWRSAKILLATTATAVIASQVARKLYKYFFTTKHCSQPETQSDDTCNDVLTLKNREINDVILFSDGIVRHTIKVPPNKDITICESRELNCFKLIKYIKSARETLDVCMYLITSSDIAEQIIRLGQKHVLVRIVVDSDMAFTPQSQINRLKEYSKYCYLYALIHSRKSILTYTDNHNCFQVLFKCRLIKSHFSCIINSASLMGPKRSSARVF